METQTHPAGEGNEQQGQESASVGVGKMNDRRNGNDNNNNNNNGQGLGEGSQRSSGGSGGEQLTGDQLTGSQVGRAALPGEHGAWAKANERSGTDGGSGKVTDSVTDSGTDSGARAAQDTRSDQARAPGTGLGTPETGANQDERDVEDSERSKGSQASR